MRVVLRVRLGDLYLIQGLSSHSKLCKVLRLVTPFFQRQSRRGKVECSQISSCVGTQTCVAPNYSRSTCINQPPTVLGLAKPVEHLQAALRATQATGPLGEQLTTVARQVAYFLYLTYDAIVWANAVKFITLSPERAQKANKTANRFWLSGITLSIINAAFKTQRITTEISRLRRAGADEKVSSAVDREAKLRGLEAYAQPSLMLTFRPPDRFIIAPKQRPNNNLSSMRLTSGSQPLRSDS